MCVQTISLTHSSIFTPVEMPKVWSDSGQTHELPAFLSFDQHYMLIYPNQHLHITTQAQTRYGEPRRPTRGGICTLPRNPERMGVHIHVPARDLPRLHPTF